MLAYQEIKAANEGKGCLGKAAPEESVFILRAQDKFAPQLVEAWAALVHQYYSKETPKTTEARQLAQHMREWQKANIVKVPD